jgi:hypothetical protein
MTGGLLQLIANGVEDAILINDPEITFFKIVYKRYTAFAILQTLKNMGNKNFNSFNSYKLDHTGDLLYNLYFDIFIPKFTLIKNSTTTNIQYGSYNINQLEVVYNNYTCYILSANNTYFIVPEYIFKIFNYIPNNYVVTNTINYILPELLNSNNFSNYFTLEDIQENTVNPIISLLRKYNNFFEDYFLLTVLSNDYEYNNQLITKYSYINYLNNNITNHYYNYYNYFKNTRLNKDYYNFNEIQQYLNYQNIPDITMITQNNFDVDVIYNYCIQNNISNYLTYQTNGINNNSLFIYNVLNTLYPPKFIPFTFWKKFVLLPNNEPNIDNILNTFNSFGEWGNNLQLSFNTHLLTIPFQLLDIYTRNYSIVQNNIIQLFNLLNITNPQQLFINLSTFINQYDLTTDYINFDDYNSSTNLNLLSQKINQQLNNYTSLNILNANIYAVPNIAKYLTIYPVDLMIIYPYLAYNLVENLIGSLYFTQNIFLVLWRNKINNFYFFQYHQYKTTNTNNNNLYDSYSLNRNLTFFANLDLRNNLFLSDIKKYLIEVFYSSSFYASVSFSDNELTQFINTTNNIYITQTSSNNAPISLNENTIQSYSTLKVVNTFNITNFTQKNNVVTIPNFDNNTKSNTTFTILFNNIVYNVESFTNINLTLTLTFKSLPIINNFTLTQYNSIQVPLVTFSNIVYPNVPFVQINIFQKTNNSISLDNISAPDYFNVNNLIINIDKNIINYYNYFKIIKITTNTKIYRILVNILNVSGKFTVTTINQKDYFFNKNNIKLITVEFVNILFRDIGTKDSNIIFNNTFSIPVRNDWVVDPNKTYWLVYLDQYIPLKYKNQNFIVNDPLIPNIYTIREIDNNSLPSFYLLLNYYNNPNRPSDIMDFFFQTPMIFLTNSTINIPYFYFYNIPFIIDNQTTMTLNNKSINLIIPINSNQFFIKGTDKISTLFDKEILTSVTTRIDLLTFINQKFDSFYNDPQYIAIINLLEQAKNDILNLNFNMFDNTLFGNTTQLIINNIKKINNYDLINFNNEDFEKYHKLALDLYGNNSTLISSPVIQNINKNIYIYPIVSYINNRKLTSTLTTYLNNIPKFFQDQLSYINANIDYQNLTNKNEYFQSYDSLNKIKLDIQSNAYDFSDLYIINTLYAFDPTNLSSIYYNNFSIDISGTTTKTILTNNFDKIIQNDKLYKTSILETNYFTFDKNKFNYIGPIYLNSSNTIIFENSVDKSKYQYIQCDDGLFYSISSTIPNIVIKNGNLVNFYDTSQNVIFNYYGNIYYCQIQFDLSNNTISGNYIYNKNYYYFDIVNKNTINIISNTIFDYNINNYFIGNTIINSINDLFNINNVNISFISFNNIRVIESYQFNYFSNIIYNNILVDNTLNPIIRFINNYYFIYINSTELIKTFYVKIKKYIPMKPVKFYSNYNANEELYVENKYNSYVKLNKYICPVDNINLIAGNYELSIYPNNQLHFIPYDICGYVSISGNFINFSMNNFNCPLYSYYSINNSIIFIENNNNFTIYDNNINYYKKGFFNKIYLLDPIYFSNTDPIMYQRYNYMNDYINLSLTEYLFTGELTGSIICKDQYVLDSNKTINSYNSNTIYIDSKYEITVEMILTNSVTQFIRPIILRYNQPNLPKCTFTYNYNGTIFNNSFMILPKIPIQSQTFATLQIANIIVTSLVSLQPAINIVSNNNFSNNNIIFNDTTGLIFNKNYLWKFMINNTYPVYFWTYFSNTNFVYTTNAISEPIYIDQNNKNLFMLSNTQLLGCLPNILTTNNNMITIANYYIPVNRKLTLPYFIQNHFNNSNQIEIIENNFESKYIPNLLLLSGQYTFTKNYIFLDSKLLSNANYLILINGSNYFYVTILNYYSDGILVSTNLLDNNYSLTIYYTFNNIQFQNNNLKIHNNQIIKYQYNDLNNNEIILINNNLYLVLGLNSNKYYDLLPLQVNIINSNILGYYSLGILYKKTVFKKPITDYYALFIYNQDSRNVNIGDYYIINNIIQIKLNTVLQYDVFTFNEKGTNVTLYVKNNQLYNLGELNDFKYQEIILYNDILYRIKAIKQNQIYLYQNISLPDGFYSFYYPYQPFNYDFVNNLPNNYLLIETISGFIPYTSNLSNDYVRYLKFSNSVYFENEVILDKYINQEILNNDITVNLTTLRLSDYRIDLNTNKILYFNFFYYQPIKINSTINYVQNILYRDTTILLDVFNILPFGNLTLSLTPQTINLTKYYSIYDIQDFKIPNTFDISNNIFAYYVQNNTLLNVSNSLDLSGSSILFVDNYIPIANNNIIIQNLEIGSYHLLLEINPQNEYFVHFIRICYPNNLLFYTNIVNQQSDFYFDKIYKIIIDFNSNTFIFDNQQFFTKTQTFIKNNDLITLWYKYPITTNGVPFYQNDKFYLELLNANQYIGKNIYLQENDVNIYQIIIYNKKFYLISDTYLGNNINYIYLQNINYIQSNQPNIINWKSNLTQHSDPILFKNNYPEKITIKVQVTLNVIGDYYKYILTDLNNNLFTLNNNTYTIGDPSLSIHNSYIYNSKTYIFTSNPILTDLSNITELFTVANNGREFFDKIYLSKTVPELISKIDNENNIKLINIIQPLKTWKTWSILQNYRNPVIQGLLVKYNNVWFTQDEYKYLTNLLNFIKNDVNEVNKINIQTSILKNILLQLPLWMNDSSFWLNVTNRINTFLNDFNYICIFNGNCLVFPDEINNIDKYFLNGDRIYYLNNQYQLISTNTITRDMTLLDNIVFNKNGLQLNQNFIGIEVNQLLKTLVNLSQDYINFIQNLQTVNSTDFGYLNGLKLIINNIWLNYKDTLSLINQSFNQNLSIQYDDINYNNINVFDTNFNLKNSDISNQYIFKYYKHDENYYIRYQPNYTLESNSIYPYIILFENNDIIAESVYQIKFYDYYQSILFNLNKYPVELNFYLNNDIYNINYSIVGRTNYFVESNYLGSLFSLYLYKINYKHIDSISYKNSNLYIYKYDISNIYLASLINITTNNILELHKTIGIKNVYHSISSTFLSFYQYNFNYIQNYTYLNINNIYIPLLIDISKNYYVNNKNIFNNDLIDLVILYYIDNVTITNTFIYNLTLNKPFIYYNSYIIKSYDIIPTNFILNNIKTPLEVIFQTEKTLVINMNNIMTISSIAHYINVGENPPIQISNIQAQNKYLYNTYDTYSLLDKSIIYIVDNSHNLLNLNNVFIGDISYLPLSSSINFLLNYNLSNDALARKTMLISNTWEFDEYIYDPNNHMVIFNYPTDLNLNSSSNYSYICNNQLIPNNKLFVGNNKLRIDLKLTISSFIIRTYDISGYYDFSGNFYSISGHVTTSGWILNTSSGLIDISGTLFFTQIYTSNSIIYKPIYNQKFTINLVNNNQVTNNGFIINYDKYGDDIGLYLYLINTMDYIEIQDYIDIKIIDDSIFTVKLFYWIDNYNLIIGTNRIISSNQYNILINNTIYRINSVKFYQNSYQSNIFYYQDCIENFYIFMNENTNSLNFINQVSSCRYYFVSKTENIIMNNIFNPRELQQSINMKIVNVNITSVNNKIEKPIIDPTKIFNNISFYIGNNLLETLNPDVYNINYNYYFTDERKIQFAKLTKVIEMSNGYKCTLPLIFCFNNESKLSMPFISLPYIELYLKYQINSLSLILKNDLTNTVFSNIPQIQVTVCLDTIILDVEEREYFSKTRIDYLFERFIVYPTKLVYNINQNVNLHFKNLVKDIFWIAKPIYSANTYYESPTMLYDQQYGYYVMVNNEYQKYKSTLVYTETNIKYINDFNILINIDHEIFVNNSDRIKKLTQDSYLSKYDIRYSLYFLDKFLQNVNYRHQLRKLLLYYVNNYKNEKVIQKISPIQTMNIQSNGIDMMPPMDNTYFNLVIPYQKFKTSVEFGYYTHSFSLNPLDKFQPSGKLNFNTLDNVALVVISDNKVINEPYNLICVVKEYTVLRIMSGMAAILE